MKTTYHCLIILLFLPLLGLGQNFEGTVTYKVDVEVLPKFAKMGITKEALRQRAKQQGLLEDSLSITYSGGNYRADRGMAKKTWNIYRSDSNKIYTFMDSSDLVKITDAAVDPEGKILNKESDFSITEPDTTVIVNGKSCNIVHIAWKSGEIFYYFCHGYLPMDADLYKGHAYNGWYSYLKLAKAVPVQFKVVLNNIMLVTYTMTNIKEEKVASNVFAIPKLVSYGTDATQIPGQTIMKIKN